MGFWIKCIRRFIFLSILTQPTQQIQSESSVTIDRISLILPIDFTNRSQQVLHVNQVWWFVNVHDKAPLQCLKWLRNASWRARQRQRVAQYGPARGYVTGWAFLGHFCDILMTFLGNFCDIFWGIFVIFLRHFYDIFIRYVAILHDLRNKK